jgi:hypothetical protein
MSYQVACKLNRQLEADRYTNEHPDARLLVD